MRGCTPQWGRGSEAVRRAAEQQAKCHAQHASGAFETMPPDDFWRDAREVELRPGSMLYVPAGMWHRVECTEDSVSINVSLMGGVPRRATADRRPPTAHTLSTPRVCSAPSPRADCALPVPSCDELI